MHQCYYDLTIKKILLIEMKNAIELTRKFTSKVHMNWEKKLHSTMSCNTIDHIELY